MEAVFDAEYLRGLEAAVRAEFLKPEYGSDELPPLSGLTLPAVTFTPPSLPPNASSSSSSTSDSDSDSASDSDSESDSEPLPSFFKKEASQLQFKN